MTKPVSLTATLATLKTARPRATESMIPVKAGELVGDAFMFYETPEGEMYFGDTETAATGTEDVDKQKQEAGFPPPL